MSVRTGFRLLLALFYLVAGVFHLAAPHAFIGIVPPVVPHPAVVILLTGIAEIAGAAALVQWFSPALRRVAGWSLAAYALCVWPANVEHMLLDMAKPDHGLGLGYHIPRLAAQPLLIWLALWVSHVTNWPFTRRRP